jgi:MoaA/NifB/PqqE/SkfB family radical SAM enzyme
VESGPQALGELSHTSKRDLDARSILGFARQLDAQHIQRIVLAGGEPLIWPHILPLIRSLKDNQIQVVLATNGTPLGTLSTTEQLLELGVDAISISLDSFSPSSNDAWRLSHNREGFSRVLRGIETLLRLRRELNSPVKAGIYSVVHRHNLRELKSTSIMIGQMGLDYHIYQPVSLSDGHSLHHELSLRSRDIESLVATGQSLLSFADGIHRPGAEYLNLLNILNNQHDQRMVPACFAGRNLLFLQPDGTLWPCPSTRKIDNMRESSPILDIRDSSHNDLRSCCSGSENRSCSLFSEDCVNMWPLMAFDAVLHGGSNKWVSLCAAS